MKPVNFCVVLSGISFALLAFSLGTQIFRNSNNPEVDTSSSNQLVFLPPRAKVKEFIVPQTLSKNEIEKNQKQRDIEKAAISDSITLETEEKYDFSIEPTAVSFGTSDTGEQNNEPVYEIFEDSFQEESLAAEEPADVSLKPNISTENLQVGTTTFSSEVVDTTMLEQIIVIGRKFESWLYTPETFPHLKKEIKKAEKLRKDSHVTQQKLDAQILSLIDSIKSLERKSDSELSKLALYHVIQEMEALDENDFSSSRFEDFSVVLKEIKKVYADPQASFDEVREAIGLGEVALKRIQLP